jgi:quercetin dioxygenase-like cupin family protein
MSNFSYAQPKENFPKGEKFSFVNSVQYAEGSIVSKILLRNEKGNVTVFAFDKGEFLSEHTAPFDALVQVLDGNAEVVIDGNSNRLVAGESILMPASIPHSVHAVEKFKMLLTMIKG